MTDKRGITQQFFECFQENDQGVSKTFRFYLTKLSVFNKKAGVTRFCSESSTSKNCETSYGVQFSVLKKLTNESEKRKSQCNDYWKKIEI